MVLVATPHAPSPSLLLVAKPNLARQLYFMDKESLKKVCILAASPPPNIKAKTKANLSKIVAPCKASKIYVSFSFVPETFYKC